MKVVALTLNVFELKLLYAVARMCTGSNCHFNLPIGSLSITSSSGKKFLSDCRDIVSNVICFLEKLPDIEVMVDAIRVKVDDYECGQSAEQDVSRTTRGDIKFLLHVFVFFKIAIDDVIGNGGSIESLNVFDGLSCPTPYVEFAKRFFTALYLAGQNLSYFNQGEDR